MDDTELHKLIDGYFKNEAVWDERLRDWTSEEWFWAWTEVEQMVRVGSPDVMRVILGLIGDARATRDFLGGIGAGPLEDLINWHGERFVDQIAAAAEDSDALRAALDSVRFGDDVPASVRGRLARFVP